MIKLNREMIKEKEIELTHFKGGIPSRLDLFINLNERFDYLRSIGLYDKVQKWNAHYKYLLMNSDNPDQVMDDLLIEFVNENPQFKCILEFE